MIHNGNRITAGGPGSGPQGPRHEYIPHPRAPGVGKPAAKPAARVAKPKPSTPAQRNNHTYGQHASKGVKISPQGQIKLTAPKSAADANEMLGSMTAVADSALADYKAAFDKPPNSVERVTAELRLAHVNSQLASAIRMSQPFVKDGGDKQPAVQDRSKEPIEDLVLDTPKGESKDFGGDQKSMETWGEKHYGDSVRSLPQEQKDALLNYMEGSSDMNHQLREGKLDKDTSAQVKLMDEAISKAPPIPETITVERGMFAKNLGDVKTGDVVTSKGFTSTALNKDAIDGYASDFKGSARLTIEVPKGSKAMYLGSQPFVRDGAFSGKANDQEILLPRDSQLEIISVSTIKGIQHVSARYVQ